MIPFAVVEVQWDDAATSHGWEDAKELKPVSEIAHTIGFLVKETADHIVVASTVGEDGSNNARIQIPKRMIRKRRIVRKAK